MNDDIEFLDIDDDLIIKKEVKEVKKVNTINKDNTINKTNKVNKDKEGLEENMKKTKRKIKKSVKRKMQVMFCSISALFILGCIIFYGYRFVKYYKIYNPKIDSNSSGVFLANYITGKSEYATDGEDGLYSSSGNYIYKGNVNNNYLKYNNMLWRIVRINSDKSIDIILDDYINILPWDNSLKKFKESEIFKYLNTEFLNNLDKSMLTENVFCTDEINDLTKITCNNQNSDSYVKLLDVANFLNSINNSKSYLVKSDEIFWLSNIDSEKVWHTNGINVSESLSNVFYEIKPMVRLKETNLYVEGDGSKTNPYMLTSNNVTVGSTLELGNDKWIVYNIDNNNYKLMRKELLEKQLEFDQEKLTYDESTLMKYLNNEYLNGLSYKDLLVNDTWLIGEYKDSIYDVKKSDVKAKVGIPNILDIKFDSNVVGYFTSTVNEERVFVYENPLRPSKVTTYRSIRPCITLSRDTIDKLKYVDGVYKLGE